MSREETNASCSMAGGLNLILSSATEKRIRKSLRTLSKIKSNFLILTIEPEKPSDLKSKFTHQGILIIFDLHYCSLGCLAILIISEMKTIIQIRRKNVYVENFISKLEIRT